MLRVTPHGIFSWDFTILRDGRAIADIDTSWFRECAKVKIGVQTYSIYRLVQRTFVLQSEDRILARAQKVSTFNCAFDIDVAGRHLELKALSLWTRRFGLFENHAQIGRIVPAGWLGREAIIDLPEDIAVPIQIFLFCQVL